MEPGGLPSTGSRRVGHDRSDLAYLHTQDQRCTDSLLLSQKPFVCLTPCSTNHESPVWLMGVGSPHTGHCELESLLHLKCGDHYLIECLGGREPSANTWGSLGSSHPPPSPLALCSMNSSCLHLPGLFSSVFSTIRLHLGSPPYTAIW